jgi:hypothetical protein
MRVLGWPTLPTVGLPLALALVVSSLLYAPATALAHSGRTDAAGGHWETATGTYHFHNGGSGSVDASGSGDGGAFPAALWAVGLGAAGLVVYSQVRKK